MDEDANGRRSQSLGGFLFGELRQAIQDIRQKVVEEGWFGRVVTAAPVVEESGHANDRAHDDLHARRIEPEQPRPSFDELWRPGPAAHEQGREHGLDIDH
ncbi:MAG: hypothetical protein JSR60_18605 [Proteobacteria bacterium]|nr:hypothetical protein [Pseudomonadota bacterium]